MTTTNHLLLLLATVFLLSSSALGAQLPPQYDCSKVIYSDNCKPVTCYTDCLKKYTVGEGLCVPEGCKCNFYCKALYPQQQPN
ncbi:hypothetical protein QYE76_025843 [Lolium multiflorum]|uniref:Defensin-like protein n=1 Tax=Lolium multiflorum TaxID=4521 RepID=A0AAD8RGG9_LOLMU|nr:hypothetical protein QYE76_025843 [Lolium multiflorum]